MRVIATEIGKFIQKEPAEAKLLLEAIWNEGSFESRQIAGKSLKKLGSKNPKICLVQDKDAKKAVTWMLREITKKNLNEVTKFLEKWAKTKANKDTQWVIKEGMKKLSNNGQKQILGLLG